MASRRGLTEHVRSFLELFALCGFAIAQPLLAVFGESPETFVFRGVDGPGIVAFAVLVVAIPAVVLFGAELLVGLAVPTARRRAHLALVGMLSGTFVVVVVDPVGRIPRPVLLLGAGVVAIGSAALFARFAAVRTWTRCAAAAPVAFLVLFLFASPVAPLVRSGDGPSASELGTIDSTTPVVVIVFDELPLLSLLGLDGGIDADLFPNFAALAAESDWYPDTTTPSGHTTRAVPALLTGQDPEGADVAPVWSVHPDNLFTLVGGSYELHVAERLTQLCPPALCDSEGGESDPGGLRGVFDDALSVLSDRAAGRAGVDQAQFVEELVSTEVDPEDQAGRLRAEADDELQRSVQVERVAEFLGSLDGDPTRRLAFLHMLLPHRPFRFLPGGTVYDERRLNPGLEDLDHWTDAAWPVLLNRQRHVLQLQYTDSVLGEIVARLRELGWYDESLLVVTADHGASFTPGARYRAAGPENFHEVLWVPLLIRAPGQEEGRVVDGPVRLTDVVPTIADRLGIEVPWSHDGAVAGTRAADEVRPYWRSAWESGDDAAGWTSFDGAEGRRRLAADRYPSLREGDDPTWWPYQVGPSAELVGRPVGELVVGETSGVRARLSSGPGRDDVAAEVVPGLVAGQLVDGPSDATVVVAWDGRVAGASPVFEDEFLGDDAFAVVVPEPLLSGPGELALYTLDPTGELPRLRPVEVR